MKRSGKGIGSSCCRFEKVAEHSAIPGVPRLQASEFAKLLASPSGLKQAKSVPQPRRCGRVAQVLTSTTGGHSYGQSCLCLFCARAVVGGSDEGRMLCECDVNDAESRFLMTDPLLSQQARSLVAFPPYLGTASPACAPSRHSPS